MATLAPLSDLGDSTRGTDALGILLEESPHLRFMEQQSGFEEDATDFQLKPEDSTTAGQGRALGGDYTRNMMVPGTPIGGSLAFFGDAVSVDISHQADASRGLRSVDVYLQKRFIAKFRAWSRKVEVKFFQGDPALTATDPNGYRTMLTGGVLPGFSAFRGYASAADYLGGAAVHFDLSDPANDDAFIEAMDYWCGLVRNATGIEVSPAMHTRMTTIARRKHILGEGRDLFGRPISTFNGIPLVRLNEETITKTEANKGATANNTTSLYIQSPGEMRNSVVTNSGLYFRDRGELEAKEAESVVWEVRAQNKVEEEKSILRVAHFKI